MRQAPLGEGGPDVAGQGVRGQPGQDDVVERGRGRPIALAETGGGPDDDMAGADLAGSLVGRPAQGISAAEVTRQIGANSKVDGWGRREAEVREKARESLQLVQRGLGPLRQRLERATRQVAVLSLDRAKLVDDYRPVPRPGCGAVGATPYRPLFRQSTAFWALFGRQRGPQLFLD